MLKNIIRLLVFYTLVVSFSTYGSVYPVVINTEYKPGNWQPLPAEKIKQAAAYTALQEISSSKRFAFFQNQPKNIKAGRLQIKINLVEAAETATVNISLLVPGQASLYATHSSSLSNLYYDGIYRQFQRAGTEAGKKLIRRYLAKYPETVNRNMDRRLSSEIIRLNSQLTQINNNIIHQTNMISTLQNESSLKEILKDYEKIDRVIEVLKKQDVKLDTIIDEVGQINRKIDQAPKTQVNINQKYILENAVTGQNKIPAADQKGPDEHMAQQLYNRAQKHKRNANYREAVKLLKKAVALRTSIGLKTLISDELFYQLPMFEAQAIAIDLGRNFQKYSQQNIHKQKLDRIRELYEFALANNQNDFQRTRQIQQALDQHINTSRAMTATLSVQARSNFTMIHQQMEEQMMMRGEYPDKQQFERMLRDFRQPHKLISYKTKKYTYQAKLRAPDGRVIQLKSDGNSFIIDD